MISQQGHAIQFQISSLPRAELQAEHYRRSETSLHPIQRRVSHTGQHLLGRHATQGSIRQPLISPTSGGRTWLRASKKKKRKHRQRRSDSSAVDDFFGSCFLAPTAVRTMMSLGHISTTLGVDPQESRSGVYENWDHLWGRTARKDSRKGGCDQLRRSPPVVTWHTKLERYISCSCLPDILAGR